MRPSRAGSFWLGILLATAACDGSITGSHGVGDGGLPGDDGGLPPGGDGGGDGGGGDTDGGPVDVDAATPPPCTAATLADAVRVTDVTVSGAIGTRAFTAQAGTGSVVVWTASDGVHVTPLDVVDQRAGADLVVDGTQVFGAAATAADVAVLVSRAPDYMTFTRIDFTGAVLGSADLVGGGDHAVQGVEWFGEFANTARMVSRGDGTYAAYHALHRRWPDGIGHQGDTLRLLDGTGSALGGGWGWGCSHSMDQRLAYGPTGLVPICIADCYPGKGIYFNHTQAQITPDPAANCSGGYTTRLGGLVAVTGGFFLVYQDDGGGAHLGQFNASGGSVGDRVLSASGESRLAAYADGMLLGSPNGGSTSLQRLDAAGAEVGAPASVSVALPSQDFEGRSDGEVAWAVAAGSTVRVVRVRTCE